MPAATNCNSATPISPAEPPLMMAIPMAITLMVAIPLVKLATEALQNPEVIAKLKSLAENGDETGPARNVGLATSG